MPFSLNEFGFSVDAALGHAHLLAMLSDAQRNTITTVRLPIVLLEYCRLNTLGKMDLRPSPLRCLPNISRVIIEQHPMCPRKDGPSQESKQRLLDHCIGDKDVEVVIG